MNAYLCFTSDRVAGRVASADRLYRALRAGARDLACLLLTDGKPNDLDKYEGRYGIEDTRHAIGAARKLGLQPFCVTLDDLARIFRDPASANVGWGLPQLFVPRTITQLHLTIPLPTQHPRQAH